MILNSATTPDEWVACQNGWQKEAVLALRDVVVAHASGLSEQIKWGNLMYLNERPVILIRAEPARVLFGFFRGKQLLHVEPRLRGGGKFELASLELRQDTPFSRETAIELVQTAIQLESTS
jgi:hypothetical protein